MQEKSLYLYGKDSSGFTIQKEAPLFATLLDEVYCAAECLGYYCQGVQPYAVLSLLNSADVWAKDTCAVCQIRLCHALRRAQLCDALAYALALLYLIHS